MKKQQLFKNYILTRFSYKAALIPNSHLLVQMAPATTITSRRLQLRLPLGNYSQLQSWSPFCSRCLTKTHVLNPSPHQPHPMATSLTGTGVVWALISLVSAALASTAFYLPYWLHGTLPSFNNNTSKTHDVYFGSFRRCNYPKLTPQGDIVLVAECGRYTTFSHVPSVSWQVSTVLVGGASAVALLVAFTAVMACCVTDIINQSTARAAGLVQLVAAVLMCVGLVIYPNGWHAREVREACGGVSEAFVLGTCQLSYSYYTMCGTVVTLLICVCMSLKASRVKSGSYRI
uniref:LHFPL tetraspan subfamily member 6 protein n=1 Tax=Strigamia maritima TaxID=126957 RepID=T1IZR1_STRMM